MQSIEMHHVNYGECIVLRGADKEILMVDCGDTVSGRILQMMKRYSLQKSRTFLLTHLQINELSILEKIININPKYFNRIYLPVSPINAGGRHMLLEFALFVFAFFTKKDEFYKENEYVLGIFYKIAEKCGADRIFTLKSGSKFDFDSVEYDVLWPKEKDYKFSELFSAAVEEMDVCLSSPFLPKEAQEFLKLKKQFCSAYLTCCKTQSVHQNNITHMYTILNSIEKLKPKLRLLPNAPDITEILERPSTRSAYEHERCSAGVIFQNRRKTEASTDDILMTGSATPESMDAVAEKLYGGYYILKAPQHGIDSAWSHIFNEIGASHILISNGNSREYGNISSEYIELPAVKHCTDCTGCNWYKNSGCSCNRLNCCYELENAGLTIKCPFCQNKEKKASCGIYIISSSGKHSCICDDKPININ